MVKYREIVRVFDRLKQYKKSAFEGIFSIWIFTAALPMQRSGAFISFIFSAGSGDPAQRESAKLSITILMIPIIKYS